MNKHLLSTAFLFLALVTSAAAAVVGFQNPILRGGFLPIRFMWRDHFHVSFLGQLFVENAGSLATGLIVWDQGAVSITRLGSGPVDIQGGHLLPHKGDRKGDGGL